MRVAGEGPQALRIAQTFRPEAVLLDIGLPGMSGFEADRANRKAARALFEGRFAQVKDDLAARGVRDRIVAKAKDDALSVADEALAVAMDNKGLIAATVASLLAWAFRAPLLNLLNSRHNRQAPVQPEFANDDLDEMAKEPAQ